MVRKRRESVEKKIRERLKLEKRGGKGKPAGAPGVKAAKKKRVMKLVILSEIGSGFFPRFTKKEIAMLKSEGRVNVDRYAFVKDFTRSTDKKIYFEASYGMDLTSRRKKFLGTFLIDLEKQTIRKVEGSEFTHGSAGSGRPQKGKEEARKPPKSPPARLNYSGRGRPPEIPQQALSQLLSLKSTKFGRFNYIVNAEKSTASYVFVTIETAGKTKRKIGDYKIFRYVDQETKQRSVWSA